MVEKGGLTKVKVLGFTAGDMDFSEDGSSFTVRIDSLTDRSDRFKMRFSVGDLFIVGTGLDYRNKSVYELEKKTRTFLTFKKSGFEPETSEEEIDKIRKEIEEDIQREQSKQNLENAAE